MCAFIFFNYSFKLVVVIDTFMYLCIYAFIGKFISICI